MKNIRLDLTCNADYTGYPLINRKDYTSVDINLVNIKGIGLETNNGNTQIRLEDLMYTCKKSSMIENILQYAQIDSIKSYVYALSGYDRTSLGLANGLMLGPAWNYCDNACFLSSMDQLKQLSSDYGFLSASDNRDGYMRWGLNAFLNGFTYDKTFPRYSPNYYYNEPVMLSNFENLYDHFKSYRYILMTPVWYNYESKSYCTSSEVCSIYDKSPSIKFEFGSLDPEAYGHTYAVFRREPYSKITDVNSDVNPENKIFIRYNTNKVKAIACSNNCVPDKSGDYGETTINDSYSQTEYYSDIRYVNYICNIELTWDRPDLDIQKLFNVKAVMIPFELTAYVTQTIMKERSKTIDYLKLYGYINAHNYIFENNHFKTTVTMNEDTLKNIFRAYGKDYPDNSYLDRTLSAPPMPELSDSEQHRDASFYRQKSNTNSYWSNIELNILPYEYSPYIVAEYNDLSVFK